MENAETPKPTGPKPQTLMFGILIIGVGIILLLKNMGVLNSGLSRIILSWPMLIIAIGLLNLDRKSRLLGFILIAVGSFFLLTRYLGYPTSIGQIFWPSIFIIVGLVMIFNAGNWGKRHHITAVSQGDDVLNESVIFGGLDKLVYSDSFRGGEVVTVFGGAKINLLKANLAPGTNVLELVAVFGGSTLIVPTDWNVKLETVNILGGFSDKRPLSQVDSNKILIVKGVAIFGGGEIKSF